jgi:hypothetical protein
VKSRNEKRNIKIKKLNQDIKEGISRLKNEIRK